MVLPNLGGRKRVPPDDDAHPKNPKRQERTLTDELLVPGGQDPFDNRDGVDISQHLRENSGVCTLAVCVGVGGVGWARWGRP
jgi:hypothetical protein